MSRIALNCPVLPIPLEVRQTLIGDFVRIRLIGDGVFPLLLGIYLQTGANSEIRRIVRWGIEVCARRNDVGSLCWFLYASIVLRIKIGKAGCDQCFGLSSEIVDVMLYHGRALGLFSPSLAALQKRYLGAAFSTPAWLTLYEVGRRGWDTSAAFNKIGGPKDPNNLYAQLRAANVEFYLTDPAYFRVEAFEGWNLQQWHFAPIQPVEFDWEDLEIGGGDENYD